MTSVKNDLFDYDNLKIYQYEDKFKFSLDSILLAEFVELKETTKTIDASWYSLKEVPELAYDYNKLLEKSVESLKEQIISSDILKRF